MSHLYGKLEALEPFEAAEIKKRLKKHQKKRVLKVNNYLWQWPKCMVLNYRIQLKY